MIDLMDLVRSIAAEAARAEESTNYPMPCTPGSPLLATVRQACVERGFTASGMPVSCAPAAARQVVADERAAFETRHQPTHLRRNQHGVYETLYVYAAWQAWQARATLAAAPAAQVDAKDAERWRTVLRFVGADRSPALGNTYFVLRGIFAAPGVDLMRGSAAGHFTDSIDAAIAAKAVAR